jgi:hypothetical protein
MLRLKMIQHFLARKFLNTIENEIKLIASKPNGKEIYYFVYMLNAGNLLNQNNFDLLMQHAGCLSEFLKLSYSLFPTFSNYDDRGSYSYYLDQTILQKMFNKNIKRAALECAQLQHASRQPAHFFYRAPDDVLKHIYSFTLPLKDTAQKQHCLKNILKLPQNFEKLPGVSKKHII